MEFPTALYRCPGLHQCPGGTFSCIGAEDEEQYAARIAEGWFPTMPEAMAGKAVAPQVAAAQTIEAPAPLDRDALKAEATALGLDFPKNIPTERLSEMIAEAKAKE